MVSSNKEVKISPHNRVLLDQGVLYPLLRRPEFKANLTRQWAEPSVFGPDADRRFFMTTPSAFLEALGIRIPQPPRYVPSQGEVITDDPRPIITAVWNHADAHFKSLPELDEHNLHQAALDKRAHTPLETRMLFDDVVLRVFEIPRMLHELKFNLSFDFVHKFPYPERIRDTVFNFLAYQLFFVSPASERNVSGYRLVKEIWESSYPHARSRSTDQQRENVELYNNLMRLRDSSDYFDCDLIHYAVFGARTQGECALVHCYTCDLPDVVAARIRTYKGVGESLRRFICESTPNRFPDDYFTVANGLVAYVRADGTISRVADVSRDYPPYFIVR